MMQPQPTPDTTSLRNEMQDLNRLADAFGNKLVTSLAASVIQGRKLQDIFKSLALSIANQALSQALKPLGNLAGSLLSGLIPNARGNVISGGRVMPFADGGVVNSPLLFPLRGGSGLMGEAGAEAVMPLARGRDGKLGVRGGGGSTHVTINISTPDVQGFRQSQAQVAAMLSRAVSRGQRIL
jgi:lambda family phage tail tape measure protein